MLSLAIATTLVGFALLVIGLITGQVWFAIACIAICLIGVGLLVADVLRSARAAKVSGADRSVVDDDAVDESPSRQLIDRPATPYRPAPPDAQPVGVVAGEYDGHTAVIPTESGSTAGVADQAAVGARFADTTRFADASPAVSTEGSFNDYVAATTGEFAASAAPTVATGPAPTPASGPDQRIPETERPAVSGVRWESSIPPQQSGFIDREASNWSTAGWAASTRAGEPASSSAETDEEQQPPRTRSRHRGSAGASGMPKFDPLDPNWHPPAD